MSGVEDCFYHEAIATVGNGSKEKQSSPAISQIPGWGTDATSTPAPSFGGRRMGLFEHDSHYVRLAKMGGRANLLSHPESANLVKKERVAYSKPEWMVYEPFTPSPHRVKADVIPDYMIHDKSVPTHLPGGGAPPWAEDGQSCFRREGEDSVRTYKTTKIENVAKPGQKRLDSNNNNDGAHHHSDFDNAMAEGHGRTNRRYQAGVRLGELEADFREARVGREKAAAAAAAAAASSYADAADDVAPLTEASNGGGGGYSPSSSSAPRRHSPTMAE